MRFNIKYLMLFLSIMGFISNNCINANNNDTNSIEIARKYINIIKGSMPWIDFEKLILSFSNGNLDKNKIKFIQNIADVASRLPSDKATWHNLSHKYLLFPRYDLRTKLEFEDIIMRKYKVNYKQLKKILKKPYIKFELKNLCKLLNTEEKQFKITRRTNKFLRKLELFISIKFKSTRIIFLIK